MGKQELKKHVAAVHIRNRLSLLERKVANILLLNAYEDLLIQEAHTIKVSRLAAIAGFDSKNMEVLKAALRKLAETAIEGVSSRNGKNRTLSRCLALETA